MLERIARDRVATLFLVTVAVLLLVGLVAPGFLSAGTATIIGTLVASINTDSSFETAANLGVLILVGLVTWFLVQRFGSLVVGDFIRRILTGRIGSDRVPHEELLLYKAGFGLTRIEIPKRSFVIGRQLQDLNLRALNLQILAVEDHGEVQPIPPPDFLFAQGQHLIVYGDLRKVQNAFGPVEG